MTLQLIFAWSKKIHRVSMWFAIILGVPLAITGVILENESLSLIAASSDWGYKVRELHRATSAKFALVLAVMMVTGFLMWLIPSLLKKRISPSIES